MAIVVEGSRSYTLSKKMTGKEDEVGLRILNGRPLVDGRVTELGFGLLQQHNDEMSQ